MEQKRLETKVGLFVFIGLALLAVLLIQFSKGTSLFHGTYELRLHASNVGGLQQRAKVLLAGVPIGSVSDIQLADDGKSVTILLKIYKNFKIYSDSRFVIEQSGFLGDQYVSVISVSNLPPKLVNGAEVNCQEPFNLQEVARSAAGFVQRIDETAEKLDASGHGSAPRGAEREHAHQFRRHHEQHANGLRTGDGHNGQHQHSHRHQRFAGQPRRQQRPFLFGGIDADGQCRRHPARDELAGNHRVREQYQILHRLPQKNNG